MTLLLSVLAGALGSSAQCGYNTGVINNPKQVRQNKLSGTGHFRILDCQSLHMLVKSRLTHSPSHYSSTSSHYDTKGTSSLEAARGHATASALYIDGIV